MKCYILLLTLRHIYDKIRRFFDNVIFKFNSFNTLFGTWSSFIEFVNVYTTVNKSIATDKIFFEAPSRVIKPNYKIE